MHTATSFGTVFQINFPGSKTHMLATAQRLGGQTEATFGISELVFGQSVVQSVRSFLDHNYTCTRSTSRPDRSEPTTPVLVVLWKRMLRNELLLHDSAASAAGTCSSNIAASSTLSHQH